MFLRVPNRARKNGVGGASLPVFTERLEQRVLLSTIRPPSVPLLTSDPYLSVWSNSDKLTDSNTAHWTGTTQSLVSLIRIDGVTSRLMGNNPSTMAAFPQTGVQVLPTRSIYDFDNGHVHVTMTFMQPALPSDLDAFSLPLSYITWTVRAVDGASHSVQVYDSTSSQLAVNNTSQIVGWQRGATDGMTTLRVGTTAQTYFHLQAMACGLTGATSTPPPMPVNRVRRSGMTRLRSTRLFQTAR